VLTQGSQRKHQNVKITFTEEFIYTQFVVRFKRKNRTMQTPENLLEKPTVEENYGAKRERLH